MPLKAVISASRRTDLPAAFPGWLSAALSSEEAVFTGPRGRSRRVGLSPDAVHTIVLWSKDFSKLIAGEAGLRSELQKYRQVYFLFTVTGLGGTPVEPGAPSLEAALAQLSALVGMAGHPRRVSVRFDPIVHWREGRGIRSNLNAFEPVSAAAARLGIVDIRVSFAQWYGKAVRRAQARGFAFIDPSPEEKAAAAQRLADLAATRELFLHACSQSFLAAVPGFRASSCIDGALLSALHPDGEPAPAGKDSTQRPECGCTSSLDIGSYSQACGHGCVYCYARPAE